MKYILWLEGLTNALEKLWTEVSSFWDKSFGKIIVGTIVIIILALVARYKPKASNKHKKSM